MKTLTEKLKGLEPESFWIYNTSHTRNISNQYDLYSAVRAKDITPQNPGWEMTVDRASYDRLLAVAVKLAEALERVESRSKIPQVQKFFNGDPILDYCNNTLTDCAKMLGAKNETE